MKHALIVIALVLLLPAAFTSGVFGPSAEDADLARAITVRVPLDALRKAGSASVAFEVPNTAQWSRIRESWGDPEYLIYAVSSRGDAPLMVAWPSLGVQVTAATLSGPLPVETATVRPSGYSFTRDFSAMAIKPKAGEHVRLDMVMAKSSEEPEGDIVIRPEWSSMKDDYLLMGLAPNLRPHITTLTVVGVLLLTVAALLRN